MGDQAIYVAASGAIVQRMRLEVLANNLANINTSGFKEDKSVFTNYMRKTKDQITQNSTEYQSAGESERLFPYQSCNVQVKFDGTRTDFSPGPVSHTGNTLDFAIDGNGFFCIESPQGEKQYTRKGNFTLNEEGTLVTQDGMLVLSEKDGDITIMGTSITVDEKGNIFVDGNQVDTVKVIDFDRPYSLKKVGDTQFAPVNSDVIEKETDNYKVMQEFVELSNVDPIKVMTEMIEVHRAFESYQKIMKSMDEIVAKSINEVGRPA